MDEILANSVQFVLFGANLCKIAQKQKPKKAENEQKPKKAEKAKNPKVQKRKKKKKTGKRRKIKSKERAKSNGCADAACGARGGAGGDT